MTQTPIYGTTELETNPANADVVVNEMIAVVEHAANSTKEWTVTGDFTITQTEFAEGFMHELNGTPAAAFAFGIYPVARFFGVQNNSGQVGTVYVQGQSGTGVTVATGSTATLYSDGVNITGVGTGSGGGGSGGMELIEEKSFSGVSTIAFTSIPQTFSHLIVVVRGRSTAGASPGVDVRMTFNNDGGANYDYHGRQIVNAVEGDNNAAASTSVPMGIIPHSTASAGFRGWGKAEIFDYANSVGYKSGQWSRHSIGNTSIDGTWVTSYAQGFDYRSETPITRLDLTLSAGNGTVDTSAWLYGIP